MLFIIWANEVKDFRRFGTLSFEESKEKLIVICLKAHSVHMNGENEKKLKYCHGIYGLKVCEY
jgi:uncharacterized protein YlbG (UPF0298 family)